MYINILIYGRQRRKRDERAARVSVFQATHKSHAGRRLWPAAVSKRSGNILHTPACTKTPSNRATDLRGIIAVYFSDYSTYQWQNDLFGARLVGAGIKKDSDKIS